MYKRHQLIEEVLTVFKEEEKALALLTKLSWTMPLMVYSTTLMDALLMVIYQRWLHPWRRIIAKVGSEGLRFLTMKLIVQVTDTALRNNVAWRQCSEEATTRL